MKKMQQGFTIIELLISIITIAGVIGWIINIVKLVSMGMPIDIAHTSIMFFLRIVGIFLVPLGSVLGFL